MSNALITWDQVIKNALKMFIERDKYAYFYDAKGIVLTESAMDYLISIHPEHFKKYTPDQLQQIKNYSLGKIGYDCTGFIWAITEHTIGGSADSIYNNAPEKYNNTIDNPAGTMLHLKGHAGIDIGYGFSLSMDHEDDSIIMHHSRSYPWENACKLWGIDYTGSDAR